MLFSVRSVLRTFHRFPKISSAPMQLLPVKSAFVCRNFNLKSWESEFVYRISTSTSRLMENSPRRGERYGDLSSNPKVSQLRELINSADTSDGWEKAWKEKITPWDLGKPTPIVTYLVHAQSLPKGRALVPGCGTGYDVVALAGPERYVVGLDISSTAIEKARELSASSPKKEYFSFLVGDFFNWNPSEPFDLIFDYTFFCALEPALRLAWAKKISEILKPEGELVTLIYVVTDQKEGPPFNNDVPDYEEVLHPLGFKQISIEDNELAVEGRKGREKLVTWKRGRMQSNLDVNTYFFFLLNVK